MVNDVQTSCYSSMGSHQLQHTFFALLRLLRDTMLGFAERFVIQTNENLPTDIERQEISPFLRFMHDISDVICTKY